MKFLDGGKLTGFIIPISMLLHATIQILPGETPSICTGHFHIFVSDRYTLTKNQNESAIITNIPSRILTNISHLGKMENHRLKSALGGDMQVPRSQVGKFRVILINKSTSSSCIVLQLQPCFTRKIKFHPV